MLLTEPSFHQITNMFLEDKLTEDRRRWQRGTTQQWCVQTAPVAQQERISLNNSEVNWAATGYNVCMAQLLGSHTLPDNTTWHVLWLRPKCTSYYHPWVMHSVTRTVCQSLCPVWTLTSECLDLETSLVVRRYVFRISMLRLYIKIIGLRWGSQKHNWIQILVCLWL